MSNDLLRMMGQRRITPSGPSASSQWDQREIVAKSGKVLCILCLPDAAAQVDRPLYYVLLGTPALCQDGAGKPTFSLVLMLEREPMPEEEEVTPLIQSGILSMEVTLSVAEDMVKRLGCDGRAEYRPLFAREACFKLEASRDGEDEVVASAHTTGAGMRVALAANLGREDSLEVLRALEGVSGDLQVRCEVSFRARWVKAQVRIDGSWASVYEYLRARSDADNCLSLAQLRQYFGEMLDTGGIRVYQTSSFGGEELIVPEDPDDIFERILQVSTVVLTRLTGEAPANDPRNVYQLKERPHPSFALSYSFTTSGSTMRQIIIEAGLHEVLGEVLEGLDQSQFVRLVCMPKGMESGTFVVPRRLASVRPRGPAAPSLLELSAVNRELESVSRAMQPSLGRITAVALVHSDLVGPKVVATGSGGQMSSHWWVDDAIVKGGERRNLPVGDDLSAAIWRDRFDSNLYWYAPAIELIQPSSAASVASSPFLFTYRRIGVTADGKPALVGSVRVTLCKRISEDTRAALRSLENVRSKPILMRNTGIMLSIPYIDKRNGSLRRTDIQAKVTEHEDTIIATVDLLNEAVRLCYGALAFPGFQNQPARLELTYSFDAYSPVQRGHANVVAGAKVALTPIAHTAAESRLLGLKPHYDASSGKFRLPVGEFQLIREASYGMSQAGGQTGQPSRGRIVAIANSRAVRSSWRAWAADATRPMTLVASSVPAKTTTVVANTAIWKPQIMVSGALAQIAQETKYVQRSLVRQEQLDALFPCETLGKFYRRETDAGTKADGCVDALKLGQTVVRQYGEIQKLSHPRYRVLRSLQQPGRFLILPAWYKIARFSPSIAEKAYRPTIACYSSIDIETPANNRVIYHVTLQPDIPVAVRRELQERLAAEANEPVLEYPTQVSAEANYAWTVGSGILVEPKVVRTPDSLQVTLATDVAGALLLRNMIQTSGVLGSANFKLPDGTDFQTNLSVQLTDIEGPWDTGPLDVRLEGDHVTLTNRIEQPVDVSDLLVYRNGVTGQRIAVEARILPIASQTVQVPTGTSEAYAFYSIPTDAAATIEEIRSFIEDIHTNVVFLDLINYKNHNLTKLEVQAQLKDVAGVRDVEMQGVPPQGEVQFILPLTTYLSHRILQFRVKKFLDSGQVQTTPWIEWDLEEAGSIVSLTWELIR